MNVHEKLYDHVRSEKFKKFKTEDVRDYCFKNSLMNKK